MKRWHLLFALAALGFVLCCTSGKSAEDEDETPYKGAITLINSSPYTQQVYVGFSSFATINVRPGERHVVNIQSGAGALFTVYIDANGVGYSPGYGGASSILRNGGTPIAGGTTGLIIVGQLAVTLDGSSRTVDVGFNNIDAPEAMPRSVWEMPLSPGDEVAAGAAIGYLQRTTMEGFDKVAAGLLRNASAGPTQAVASEQISLANEKPTPQQMSDAGAQAAEEAKAVLDGAFVAPTEVTLSEPTEFLDPFTIIDPFAQAADFGTVGTYHLNPFATGPDGYSRYQDLASWFRAATEWAALVYLGIFVFREFKGWLIATVGVRQATGNTFGGTGGQATALAAAGFLTVIILVALGAFVEWSFGGIGMGTLTTNMHGDPLATIAGGTWFLLNSMFPVATLIYVYVARAAFNMYCAPLFTVCASVARFVVP